MPPSKEAIAILPLWKGSLLKAIMEYDVQPDIGVKEDARKKIVETLTDKPATYIHFMFSLT